MRDGKMRQTGRGIGCVLVFIVFAFAVHAEEEYHLQYFLAKTSSKANGLTKQEKGELLNRLEETLERIQKNHLRLTSALQSGEMGLRYHEGRLWMSKAEEDLKSIETGVQQLKLLKEKPDHLVGAVSLFRVLKDLVSNLNAFNNEPSFVSFVGDLAPELVLWTDPVFFQLYLLPLAELKNVEVKPPKPEKKPLPKKK